jgi:hypothetical protein
MKKAVEADELVRSAKGEQVAHPTEQRSTPIQKAMPLGGRNHAPSQALTDESGSSFPGVARSVRRRRRRLEIEAPRRALPLGAEKSGSVAEGYPGAHLSRGLPHCRPLTVVDDVPPASIHTAAHDVACRASKVNIVAVGTFTID